jgi:ribosomal protein S21
MRVHDGEPIGLALRRFKKLLIKQGVHWAIHTRPIAHIPATKFRRKKRFQKRFKARKATLLAQQTGEQPVASLAEATTAFWKHTGKP